MTQRAVTAAIVLACAAALTGTRAGAQTASQLTPKSFAPNQASSPLGVAFPASNSTDAPKGSESIYLQVGDVRLDGGDADINARADGLLQELRGHKVSVAAIYVLANRLEQLYAAAGYFLSRVTIPQQTVRPGEVLRLVVTEGYIESVDVGQLDDHVRGVVQEILQRVVGRKRITLDAFQRALLIAGDVPGLSLSSRLEPGKDQGAVKLVLSGPFRPVSGALTSDNSLQSALGKWSSQLSAQLNSPFGFGEDIYASVGGAPGEGLLAATSPWRVAAAGVLLPIGREGLTFNPEYSWSATKPKVVTGQLATESLFQRLSLRFLYPVVRSRSDTISVKSVFDLTDDQQTAPLFGSSLYHDRLRVLRVGADLSHIFETGTLVSLGTQLSQGIHGLGSRSRSDATVTDPLSRTGANDAFTKIGLNGRLRQDLAYSFALEGTAQAQWAVTGPLLKSEQFALGGPQMLSAYDSSAFTGDSGWLVRGEVQYRALTHVFDQESVITPYLFAARGQARLRQPSATEAALTDASSGGFGARTTVASGQFIRETEIGAEVARQISSAQGANSNLWRFNLYLTSRF